MITVIAPYGRNEVTTAAIRVADLAVAMGHRVRFLAYGVRERGVSPDWDDKVGPATQNALFEAAAKSKRVVHFVCKASLLSQTAMSRRVKQILVPNLHGMSAADAELIAAYDVVVCPNAAAYQAARKSVANAGPVGLTKVHVVRWDAGLKPVVREGTVADRKQRLCLVCDAWTVNRLGGLVLCVAAGLLTASPTLDVTVAALKTWDKGERSAFARLRERWGPRLASTSPKSDVALHREFSAHDWVAFPSPKVEFGCHAAAAVACGAGLIANDVDPMSCVAARGHAVLIPCRTNESPAGATVARPVIDAWVEACTPLFDSPEHLARVRDARKPCVTSRFNQAWAEILA